MARVAFLSHRGIARSFIRSAAQASSRVESRTQTGQAEKISIIRRCTANEAVAAKRKSENCSTTSSSGSSAAPGFTETPAPIWSETEASCRVLITAFSVRATPNATSACFSPDSTLCSAIASSGRSQVMHRAKTSITAIKHFCRELTCALIGMNVLQNNKGQAS